MDKNDSSELVAQDLFGTTTVSSTFSSDWIGTNSWYPYGTTHYVYTPQKAKITLEEAIALVEASKKDKKIKSALDKIRSVVEITL